MMSLESDEVGFSFPQLFCKGKFLCYKGTCFSNQRTKQHEEVDYQLRLNDRAISSGNRSIFMFFSNQKRNTVWLGLLSMIYCKRVRESGLVFNLMIKVMEPYATPEQSWVGFVYILHSEETGQAWLKEEIEAGGAKDRQSRGG